MLFTHRGLSGPAILQISSYWREGDEIVDRAAAVARSVRRCCAPPAPPTDGKCCRPVSRSILPKRLARMIVEDVEPAGKLADLSDAKLRTIAERVNAWRVRPVGSEGYRTAEVTARRRRHEGARLQDHGGQGRAGALFHRRGGGRDRLARRLQFPVGVVVGLVRRPSCLSSPAPERKRVRFGQGLGSDPYTDVLRHLDGPLRHLVAGPRHDERKLAFRNAHDRRA